MLALLIKPCILLTPDLATHFDSFSNELAHVTPFMQNTFVARGSSLLL